MKPWAVIVAVSVSLCGCTALSPSPPSTANPVDLTKGLPRYSHKALVNLETSKGLVVLEINGEAAPVSAGNFLDLVKRGFYNGLTFHRVVKQPKPFVVQGGDPRGDGTGGFIDPLTGRERTIPLEIKTSLDTEPVYGEVLDPLEGKPEPLLHHDKGVIAWARSSEPNSASSQFYITLAPLSALDGQYAVFGKVVKGLEVVEKLEQGDKIIQALEVAPQP